MPLRRGGAISGLPYQLLKGSRGIKQAFLRISLWAPTTSPRLPTEQPAFRHTSITSTSRSIVGSAVVARAFPLQIVIRSAVVARDNGFMVASRPGMPKV